MDSINMFSYGFDLGRPYTEKLSFIWKCDM